ncbi:MAG: serine hydrolase, partial [Alphaproteobacteria bacterium]|nr:serine hydrolase [Alphaproteobacteria bacterium]
MRRPGPIPLLAFSVAILATAVGTGPATAGHGPRAGAAALDGEILAQTLGRAARLERLHALIVARDGRTVVARRFRGPGLDVPVNVKSVSKTVIAALIGAAIARGVISGPDQPVARFLAEYMPANGDPRLQRLTVGHLLSMRAGLARTSGRNYGRWVASRDWVRYALSRPFVEEPGGAMLYSTGSSHLLSALLTRAAGRTTLDLARDWLGKPLGITVPAWQRDPKGFYFGGNNMLLSPRALLRLGEMYRTGGRFGGRRVLPEGWVRASWTKRTTSPWSGDGYGYGWFITEACGFDVFYARGFGGQFIYVVPGLKMTVVITSATTQRTRVGG